MKRIVSVLLCALLLSSLCGCGSGSNAVNVQSVSMITSSGSVGFVERCAGKVVSGQTAKIKKGADKKVLEVLVKPGDMVKEGDLLFSYDADAMELSLEKLRLEYKTLENTIQSATKEIEDLERQKSMVYITNQLSYTIQIDSKQADIREAEYKKALKEREVQAMEKALEAIDVTAPIGGRVMSVSEEDEAPANGGTSPNGANSAFITIMDLSSYRVQGNINEMNRNSLTEGLKVLIRSRTDSSQVWHGTVTSIDWENPVVSSSNNNMYYMGSSDDMTSSSKYPFYVELENVDGLVLGQHVIIEPDYGQDSYGEGLWLPSYFITDAEDDPYVWAASPKGKLEKRSITLSEYNEELDLWLITEGLEFSDYLALPEEGLTAGRSVVYYDRSSFASNVSADADAGENPGIGSIGEVEISAPVYTEEQPVMDAEGVELPEGIGNAPAEEEP